MEVDTGFSPWRPRLLQVRFMTDEMALELVTNINYYYHVTLWGESFTIPG
jgi:hypothetical protein